MRAEYETFMEIIPCHSCGGRRLKPSSLAVTVGDKNIYDLTCMPIRECRAFLNELKLTKMQESIGAPILKEVKARLDFLNDVAFDCGVTGSRVMGGGFGGCTINLVKEELYSTFVEQVRKQYYEKFHKIAKIYDVVIGDGARRLV